MGFARVVISEERETSFGQVFKQDGSRSEIAGRKDHRIGFDYVGIGACLSEPLAKKSEGVIWKILFDQADVAVTSAHLA